MERPRPVTTPVSDPPPHQGPGPDEMAGILRDLPKEVGALLISVGALGVVLPGMVGVPAVIAGGLVFWPGTFGPLESWLGRKYPKAHRQSLDQIRRYLKDLERRYPAGSRPPTPGPIEHPPEAER